MSTVSAKTQKRLDGYLSAGYGTILIYFGTREKRAMCVGKSSSTCMPENNSCILAKGHIRVEADEKSDVDAYGICYVSTDDKAVVTAHDACFVSASGGKTEAWDECIVETPTDYYTGDGGVIVHDKCFVSAISQAYIKAYDKCRVEAHYFSEVEATDDVIVFADGKSHIKASGKSIVIATENCTVEARDNVRVADLTDNGTITLLGNAQVIHFDDVKSAYCYFLGIKTDGKKGLFYTIAYRSKGEYYEGSRHNDGEKPLIDKDKTAKNIDVSGMRNAFDCFSYDDNLALLELEADMDKVEFDNSYSTIQLTCSEARLLREVPPDEWGKYGEWFMSL